MLIKKKYSNKLIGAKFRLKISRRSNLLFSFFLVLMPIIIISVLAFGIVMPLYKYNSNKAIPVLSENVSEFGMTQLEIKKILTLVNCNNQLKPSYKANLENFKEFKYDSIIIPDLKKMLTDSEEQGLNFNIIKGYISYEEQKMIYEQEIERLLTEQSLSKTRARSEVEKYISPPGKDEHETGLAVNITVKHSQSSEIKFTKEYIWLQKNCVNYGFVLRYPENKETETKKSFDPTQYRYVGISNAQRMRIMDLCLEEYVSYINER